MEINFLIGKIKHTVKRVRKEEPKRQARTASGTGICHIMMRGVNRRNIFDDDDHLRFFQITL